MILAFFPRISLLVRCLNRSLSCFLFLLLFLVVLYPVTGEEKNIPPSPIPRLTPRESIILLSRDKEPLNLREFIYTALLFSGIEYNNVDILESRIFAELEDFKNFWHGNRKKSGNINSRRVSAGGQDYKKRLAEEILLYLHRRLFKRYSMWQTRVDILFETGTYNCVSSAVVYMIFARYMGLKVEGVRTRDHAFCRVVIGNKAFDVETTSPYGFDPGHKVEFKNDFGKVTGYAYVPPGNYRERRIIGDKEMLSLILFNLNAFYTRNRKFIRALGPAVDAYAYHRTKEALDKLVVSIHNVASWYGMEGKNRRGIEFLKRAISVYEGTRLEDRVVPTFRKLFYNMIIDLIESGNYTNAQAELTNGEALKYLSSADRRTLVVYLYQRWAFKVSSINGYDSAAKLILRGISLVGREPSLLKNYEAYVHNSFVSLVKRKDLTRAKSVVEEALQYYSSSPMLNRDLRYVKKLLEEEGETD